MREIKFRAWDKKNNEFVYEFYLNANRHDLIGIVPNYLKKRRDDFIMTESGDYELMQFTGLLDKNGVEIYEGDIVKTEHGATGIMQWHDTSAQFNYNCKEPMWSHPIYSMSGDKEIIGNIYSNPELLSK